MKLAFVGNQLVTMPGNNNMYYIRRIPEKKEQPFVFTLRPVENDTVDGNLHAAPDSFGAMIAKRVDDCHYLTMIWRGRCLVPEDGPLCYALIQTHYRNEIGQLQELYEPEIVMEYGTKEPSKEVMLHEISLNDDSRWKKELPKDQRVQIGEKVYNMLFEVMPPVNWVGSYFEVGEPDHHENGKVIRRACWKEGRNYYTGHPEMYLTRKAQNFQ